MNLPIEKQQILDKIVRELTQLRGVKAVVLGGSYARGTQHANSDLDIGLYYSEDQPFSIDEVRRFAAQISMTGEPVVTDFYTWGAWVNGGAWIHTNAGKVDFLYRNIDQVQKTITDACNGVMELDYNQQPAYGFFSVIYLAETNVCVPLYDPEGVIRKLKEQVAVYPKKLMEQTISGYLWMAEFTLLHADGFAAKGDVYSTAGALTRAASYMTQAIFALNETYFMTDKTAMKEIAGFKIAPNQYPEQLGAILGNIGATPKGLSLSVKKVRDLWMAIVALTKGTYTPAFKM
jgi:predicted nucleotidyltransferase